MNEKNKNGVFIIVLLCVVTILVLFFPKIYDLVSSISMPEVEQLKNEESEKKKEINEDVLETVHYPLMRTSSYNSNTYYSLDTFTINNFLIKIYY